MGKPMSEEEIARLKEEFSVKVIGTYASDVRRLLATVDAWKYEADAERELRRDWEKQYAARYAEIERVQEEALYVTCVSGHGRQLSTCVECRWEVNARVKQLEEANIVRDAEIERLWAQRGNAVLAFEGLQVRYADFKEEAYAYQHDLWLGQWGLLGQVIYQSTQAMDFVGARNDAWREGRRAYERARTAETKVTRLRAVLQATIDVETGAHDTNVLRVLQLAMDALESGQ